MVPARQAADEESGDAGPEERKVYTFNSTELRMLHVEMVLPPVGGVPLAMVQPAQCGRQRGAQHRRRARRSLASYSASSQSPRCHQSRSVLPVTVNREALAVCLCSFAREPLAATPSWWGLSHL